jgi:FixJ family two-component response regulator
MTSAADDVKVFVVDDDAFVLKWVTRQINGIGYADVSGYTSAREAMSALAAETGARRLVFCDLQMPEIDGVKFVRYLVDSEFDGGLVLVSGDELRRALAGGELTNLNQPKVVVGSGRHEPRVEQ